MLRAGRWVALADRDHSVYLPLNNAWDVLWQLRFQGRSQQLTTLQAARMTSNSSGLFSQLPGRFQRHRVLHPDSVATLEQYAQAVERGRWLFVSYRWRDFENNERG